MVSQSTRHTARCLVVLLLVVSALPAAAAPRRSWGSDFLSALWYQLVSGSGAETTGDTPFSPQTPGSFLSKEGCLTDPLGTPVCSTGMAPPPVSQETCVTGRNGKLICSGSIARPPAYRGECQHDPSGNSKCP